MSTRQAERAAAFKARGFVAASQASRRAAILARQRARRDDHTAGARRRHGGVAAIAFQDQWSGDGDVASPTHSELQRTLEHDRVSTSNDLAESNYDDNVNGHARQTHHIHNPAEQDLDTEDEDAAPSQMLHIDAVDLDVRAWTETEAAPPSSLSRGVSSASRRRARRPRSHASSLSDKTSAAASYTWQNPAVTLPEWLLEIPPDLPSAWYVMPRPDGKRCFVVASGGRTVVRSRDGRPMRIPANCRSALPGGRPGSRGVTILDCIVVPEAATHEGLPNTGGASSYRAAAALRIGALWVLDVMIWNDMYMYDCTAEFRFFWIRSKLRELEDAMWNIEANDSEDDPSIGSFDAEHADTSVSVGEVDRHDHDIDDSENDIADADDGEGTRDRPSETQSPVDAAGSSAAEECEMVDVPQDHAEGEALAWRQTTHPFRRHPASRNSKRRGASFVAAAGSLSSIWIRFRPVPVFDADEVGISAASDAMASREAGIELQDGLLFYAKEAHYELGLTPVVLAWKDDNTSVHTIETFPETVPLTAKDARASVAGSAAVLPPFTPHAPHIAPSSNTTKDLIVTLAHTHCQSDDTLKLLTTCDRPALVVGTMSVAHIRALGEQADSRLLRLRVLNTAEVASGTAAPSSVLRVPQRPADNLAAPHPSSQSTHSTAPAEGFTLRLEPLGLAGPSRIAPDSWSRILFQCRARHAPVTLEHLRSAATAAESLCVDT